MACRHLSNPYMQRMCLLGPDEKCRIACLPSSRQALQVLLLWSTVNLRRSGPFPDRQIVAFVLFSEPVVQALHRQAIRWSELRNGTSSSGTVRVVTESIELCYMEIPAPGQDPSDRQTARDGPGTYCAAGDRVFTCWQQCGSTECGLGAAFLGMRQHD